MSEPPKSSALVARLVAAGALGGVTAGVVELIGAASLIGDGPVFKAALFLAALDGAAGAAAGLLLGLLVAALTTTDVGALAAASVGRPKGARGATLAVYGVAISAALVGIGFGVRAVTANALVFFHHRGLIAALVGAAAAGLALVGLFVVVPFGAALLSRLPLGRRLRTDAATPAAVWAPSRSSSPRYRPGRA